MADRDGSFVIFGTPDGPRTLVVDYVGYDEATAAHPVCTGDERDKVRYAIPSSS